MIRCRPPARFPTLLFYLLSIYPSIQSIVVCHLMLIIHHLHTIIFPLPYVVVRLRPDSLFLVGVVVFIVVAVGGGVLRSALRPRLVFFSRCSSLDSPFSFLPSHPGYLLVPRPRFHYPPRGQPHARVHARVHVHAHPHARTHARTHARRYTSTPFAVTSLPCTHARPAPRRCDRPALLP